VEPPNPSTPRAAWSTPPRTYPPGQFRPRTPPVSSSSPLWSGCSPPG